MASTARHPEPNRTVLQVLERARDVYGYISENTVTALAEELGVPVVDVYAAATFYRSLPLKPRGKYVIRVCKSVPCYLKHSREVAAAVQSELGIAPGETTLDGLFSLELVNCIGACDKAPAMMIGDDVFGDLTAENVKEILASYRKAK